MDRCAAGFEFAQIYQPFGQETELGVIETASKYLASEWGSLFFFLAMAAILAWRPNGLLKR